MCQCAAPRVLLPVSLVTHAHTHITCCIPSSLGATAHQPNTARRLGSKRVTKKPPFWFQPPVWRQWVGPGAWWPCGSSFLPPAVSCASCPRGSHGWCEMRVINEGSVLQNELMGSLQSEAPNPVVCSRVMLSDIVATLLSLLLLPTAAGTSAAGREKQVKTLFSLRGVNAITFHLPNSSMLLRSLGRVLQVTAP